VTEAKSPHVQDFEERQVRIKGVRLRYLVGGAGAPVALLHGLGGAASNWVELASLLARRHRVVAVDLPGHGGSGALAAAPTLDAFADRVGLLLEHEGLLPAAVVGHSAGGLIGLRLALRRQDAVSALVLAASAGISTARRRAAVALEVLGLTRPSRALVPFRRVIARRPALRYAAFGWWGVSDPPALSAAATAGFLDGPVLHADTMTLGRALVRDDARLELSQLACPCLVLWGARDNWVLLDDGFEFARRLRAPLRLIPDCGHLLIGERPDACLDAIETFLGSR
jgi:pimeloyl-ACP methyl ester carboxylesterase